MAGSRRGARSEDADEFRERGRFDRVVVGLRISVADARLVERVIVDFLTPAGTVSFDVKADVLSLGGRERSLEWVSRCCFMLSDRVNFLLQPSHVQLTPFSAV